jgi:hypothetical protein
MSTRVAGLACASLGWLAIIDVLMSCADKNLSQLDRNCEGDKQQISRRWCLGEEENGLRVREKIIRVCRQTRASFESDGVHPLIR